MSELRKGWHSWRPAEMPVGERLERMRVLSAEEDLRVRRLRLPLRRRLLWWLRRVWWAVSAPSHAHWVADRRWADDG